MATRPGGHPPGRKERCSFDGTLHGARSPYPRYSGIRFISYTSENAVDIAVPRSKADASLSV